MTIQKAAIKGYLKMGDVISVRKHVNGSDLSHTVIYRGLSTAKHAMVYESGNIPYTLGYSNYGCGLLDYSKYKTFYITEVMRLR